MPPLGLIISGDNHFLIRGPEPDHATARLLVRRWTFPSPEDILGLSPPIPAEFQITTKEFREDIEWVIVLPSEESHSAAITALLVELKERKIEIQFVKS